MASNVAEAVEHEITVASTLYEEAMMQDESNPLLLTVQLPFSFTLEVQFPLHGYPEEKLPTFTIVNGPNAVLVSDFNASLQQEIRESIEVGQDNVLLLVLPMATTLAEHLEEQYKEEQEGKERRVAAAQETLDEECAEFLQEMKEKPFYQSTPICDRKSKFIAHLTAVSSLEEVWRAVRFLRAKKDIASAAHPSIWAYRFRDPQTERIVSDREDDGETGASSRVMFLLEHLQVEGWLVVVTRWFGGVLLGPDRFKHIMSVTREVLTQCPAIVKP